ncbi:hypothetical protein OGAPHI_006655 [Ogataea philodendri]|uniref:PH domain-containing protein n=1 Tax=Ogataea philodendri TaxID=1378263 RepID=A0A9P8T007_9ASCO|nr:uncharacterized protein OGAPHI_006655 [Ogataea philodendri]KAH3661248.1 hypothetical protein OGAPHI_006655 [Ogataea philodendri]
MNKLRAFSRKESGSSPKESSSLPKRVVTAESRGELSPALSPIVTLLSAQTHRRYNEGVFMLLKDLDSEGQAADRKWSEVYGVLIGNQLAIYSVELMEELQAKTKTNNKPSYINFTDATFKAVDVLPSSNGDLKNVIIVSTTLKNRYLIQIASVEQFRRWHAAFRLAATEYKLLQEAYTGALLSARGSLLSDIKVVLAETKFVHEDWTSVRFGAGMPWKRCFTEIEPPAKKHKKKFVPGKVTFYESEKKGKKLAMATITNANSIYAVYPQNYSVIDQSTMIKLDGSIVFSKDEGEKDCSIFLMPDQHSSVPGYDTLIRFLIPLLDAYHLYGRPKRLNADKSEIDSLLFALPVLPKLHYLEVDDLMQLTGSATTASWTSYQWTRGIKEILQPKVSNGYTGCGSTEGTVGAVGMLDFSRDFASGKVRSFSNPQSPTFAPNPKNAFGAEPRSPALETQTINSQTSPKKVPEVDHKSVEDKGSLYSELRFRKRDDELPVAQPEQISRPVSPEKQGLRNPPPGIHRSPGNLSNIYSKYAQLPDLDHIDSSLADMDLKEKSAIDDLYPQEGSEVEEEDDDEDDDYDINFVNPASSKQTMMKSSQSVGSFTTPDGNHLSPLAQPNPNYNSKTSLVSSDSGEHTPVDRRVLSQERVMSPFTEFNKSYQQAMQPNIAYEHPNGLSSASTLNVPKQRADREGVVGGPLEDVYRSASNDSGEFYDAPSYGDYPPRAHNPYLQPHELGGGSRSGSTGSVEHRPAYKNSNFQRAPPDNIVPQQVPYNSGQHLVPMQAAPGQKLQSPYSPNGNAAYGAPAPTGGYSPAGHPRQAGPPAGAYGANPNGYAPPPGQPKQNTGSPRARRPPPPLMHSQQYYPQPGSPHYNQPAPYQQYQQPVPQQYQQPAPQQYGRPYPEPMNLPPPTQQYPRASPTSMKSPHAFPAQQKPIRDKNNPYSLAKAANDSKVNYNKNPYAN